MVLIAEFKREMHNKYLNPGTLRMEINKMKIKLMVINDKVFNNSKFSCLNENKMEKYELETN